jgi:hypothetical protein
MHRQLVALIVPCLSPRVAAQAIRYVDVRPALRPAVAHATLKNVEQRRKSIGLVNNLVLSVLYALLSMPTYAAGAAEGGREQALEMIQQDQLVGPAIIDTEAFLDNYDFAYEIESESAVTIVAEVDQPIVLATGSEVTLQVAIATNTADYFPTTSFSYVLLIDDPTVFEEPAAYASLRNALARIVAGSGDRVRLYLFRPDSDELTLVRSRQDVDAALDLMESRSSRANRDDLLRRLYLSAESIASLSPTKYLWIIGRPVAESARDLGDLESTMATYRQPFSEVSFAGYDESFRADTINRLVRRFGGNSYFFDDPADIEAVINDDFEYYSRPAVGNLRLFVFEPAVETDTRLVRAYEQQAMGPGEHHTFHVRMTVPSQYQHSAEVLSRRDALVPNWITSETIHSTDVLPPLQDEYPLASIVFEYFDYSTGRTQYGQRSVVISYTDDYALWRESTNLIVDRNELILRTASVLESIGVALSRRMYSDALNQLVEHIELLSVFNREHPDREIAEDIESLCQYRGNIVELTEDPSRNRQIRSELRRLTY